MKKITAIIPFLNEGREIFNTVQNLRETAGNSIDIMLINDASTDECDYRAVADEFDCIYVLHEMRKGVAASRDEAVDLCKTDYFILLDGHMRFYQNDWVEILLAHLEREPRSLFCCQSIVLNLDENGEIVKKERERNPIGAAIDFFGDNKLKVKWSYHRPTDGDQQEDVVDVACVLGAGYVCSKDYWTRLRGLNGLRSYGSDEPLISMKVWLEGGRCRLIPNLPVGHLYRKQFPYTNPSADTLFNVVYITELFLGYSLRESVFRHIHRKFPALAENAFREMDLIRDEIEEQKRYYASIFTRDIDSVVEMNRACILNTRFRPLSLLHTDADKNMIAKTMCALFMGEADNTERQGLMFGKTEAALILSMYAGDDGAKEFAENADRLIDGIFEKIDQASPLGFTDGLTGIAWAINYMCANRLMELDAEEFFEEVDGKLAAAFNGRHDQSLYEDRIFGIGLYYLIRKGKSEALSSPAFVEKLFLLCEKKLGIMNRSGYIYSTPFDPPATNSIVAFLAGAAADHDLPDSLRKSLASYLNQYAGSIDSALDRYTLNSLLDRLYTVYQGIKGELPEIAVTDSEAIMDEIGSKAGKELLAICAGAGMNTLLFDCRPDAPVMERLQQALFDTIKNKAQWQEALPLFDNDNIGLEGLGGLAILAMAD